MKYIIKTFELWGNILNPRTVDEKKTATDVIKHLRERYHVSAFDEKEIRSLTTQDFYAGVLRHKKDRYSDNVVVEYVKEP